MAEIIDERISVNLFTNHMTGKAVPTGFFWRGRSYKVSRIGLHHTYRDGRTLLHVFSATDGTTFFRLEMDTVTLGWKLVEIDTQ